MVNNRMVVGRIRGDVVRRNTKDEWVPGKTNHPIIIESPSSAAGRFPFPLCIATGPHIFDK